MLLQPSSINVDKDHQKRQWPGLTATAVRKYHPQSLAIAKEHMKQQRKSVRSTKVISVENIKNDIEQTGECYFIITPIAATGKTFSDQTGHFPVTSSKGNKYVMIMYDSDGSNILGEAMKSCTGDEIVRTFSIMHTKFKKMLD